MRAANFFILGVDTLYYMQYNVDRKREREQKGAVQMVVYHESTTYHYEFPVGMSYEDKFRICYHREPTKAEKRDIYPNIECKTFEEAEELFKKYGGEVYKSDYKLTDEGTINEFYRIILAKPPMTIQGKTLKEWLGR